MADREEEPGGGGVAVDGDDGGHGKGHDRRQDGLEGVHHELEAVGGGGGGSGGARPGKVEAVGEEFAGGGGDEDGAGSGLRCETVKR